MMIKYFEVEYILIAIITIMYIGLYWKCFRFGIFDRDVVLINNRISKGLYVLSLLILVVCYMALIFNSGEHTLPYMSLLLGIYMSIYGGSVVVKKDKIFLNFRILNIENIKSMEEKSHLYGMKLVKIHTIDNYDLYILTSTKCVKELYRNIEILSNKGHS